MIKVFLLSHGFQQEYEVGFANGLAAQPDCDVTIVSSENTLLDRLAPSVRVLPLRGSQESGRPIFSKMKNIARYWISYLTLAAKNRDAIFHFNGLFSMRSTVAVLIEAVLAWVFIRHWVLSVHNIVPHESKGLFDKLVYRFIYMLPELLVVHTDLMRQLLINNFYISEDRIVVIEHGIDKFSDLCIEKRDVGRKKLLSIDGEKNIVLFFGKVMRYKGLEDFLDLIGGSEEIYADWFVVIAGKCDDNDLRNSLKSKIIRYNLADKVLWLDRFIDENEIEELLCAADLMIMPYRHIDQSGVIFTSLSYGLPVVATDVGSLRNYAALTGGCVTDKIVSEKFVTAINNTFRQVHWDNRATIVQRARLSFDWKIVLRPLVSKFREILRLK